MKRTKRECLMQRLPAPADILALIPAQEDTAQTAVICARENSLMLCASPEHVLACLAEREDKALSLIRRNAARLMARRRNIILPILHGCVLTPVKMYNARRGGIGYTEHRNCHTSAGSTICTGNWRPAVPIRGNIQINYRH